jgi:hypothetical protein
LLEEAVFSSNQNDNASVSPCYITQMTKAYFKDGNIDHALKFFEQNIKKLKDIKNTREEFLVSIFDSVYGTDNSEELSFKDFKNRYLRSI